MLGTFLILVGLALALSPGDGVARAGHPPKGLATTSGTASPLQALMRGLERPLPGPAGLDRIAEVLELDDAGREAVAGAVDAAVRERRDEMRRTLEGPEATAVLAIVDQHDGRPTDADLMVVAQEIVAVGRALREVDVQAHAKVWRAIEAQPALDPQRLECAERLLRRLRILGPDEGGARRDQVAGGGAGIDLLAHCQAEAATSHAAMSGVLRRFDEWAPAADADVLAETARQYAREMDAALRTLERRRSAVAEAAERAVALGDREPWDAACGHVAEARRAAVRLGERTADIIAEVIARDGSPEEAWTWRHALRRAAHPALFQSEPVEHLNDWAQACIADEETRRAVASIWREYLPARDGLSSRIVRMVLEDSDPAPPALVATGAGDVAVRSHSGSRLQEAFAARGALDAGTAGRLMALLPAESRAQSIGAERDGPGRRSGANAARAVGEVQRETQGD